MELFSSYYVLYWSDFILQLKGDKKPKLISD